MPTRFMKPAKGRMPKSLGELPVITRAVEKEAARWNCSKSFVRNVAIAYALGVKIDDDYTKEKK